MVLFDDPRLVVDANGALLRLLGHARGDVIGKPGYERGAKRSLIEIDLAFEELAVSKLPQDREIPVLCPWAEAESEDRGHAVEVDVASGCDHDAVGGGFDGCPRGLGDLIVQVAS